jgi:hypothetical protein
MSGISDENNKCEKRMNSFKNVDNSPNEKSKIKRKIRAWCSLCFQFFENGPTTKNCQEHLRKGNCNLINCKKASGTCIRKFANTNSENRHTYCLTKEEVSYWDPIYDIQLSLKTMNDFSKIANPNLSLENQLKSNDYIGNSISKIVTQDNYRLLHDETKCGGLFDDINSSHNIIKPEYIHSPNLSMVFGKQEFYEDDEEKIIYDLSNIYIDSKNGKNQGEEKQEAYLPSENQIQIQPDSHKFFESNAELI